MTEGLLPLTDDQREIVRTAKEFAANELTPHVAERDRKGEFSREPIDALGRLGFLGMLIPEEWGGSGLDTVTYLLALEEIARVDPSLAVSMSVHNSLPTQLILAHGSDDLKERYLRPMAEGRMLGAFALSEAHAGSDPAALSCSAVRRGDVWVLNGAKAWVTNGGTADVVLAMARTGGSGSRGVSAFVVEPTWEGYTVGKEEKKMGLRSSNTAEIVFRDLEVPAANLLGEEGKGLGYALGALEHGRLGIAAQALGIAGACLDLAIDWARERQAFGHPIADFQGIRFLLVDLAAQIEAARALTHAAAAKKDRGEPARKEVAMAKLLASRAAMDAGVKAIQVYGGYGYMKDYPVERYFRDAKVTEIYEGTSEIQRLVIASELLDG
ncbi:MAG TPA: acyl-CoA dehydrogenase family protein [Gemmatimonadota bacterium]|nr:acyl-CoA dehydrogenase family protein [Gemmatimonadota bacterium]